jgi:hypothetical protein
MIAMATLLVGCGAQSRRVTLSGFLPASVSLEASPHDPNVLVFRHPDFLPSAMLGVHVAPVQTDGIDRVSDEQRDIIADQMTSDIREILATSLPTIENATPSTPTLQVVLTGIEPSAPLLNIHPATKITGIGLGGVSVEAMLTDPATHRVLFATAFSRDAAKRVGSGLTKWDDAYSVVREWAQDLAASWSVTHNSP